MSVRKRIITAIIGLLFLAGCAWFLADAMGLDFMQFESSWTFILIAAGFVGLFSGDGILFNIGLMLLGAGILVRDNNWLGGALSSVTVWQMIVAILLLIVGLSVLGAALGIKRRKIRKHVHAACSGSKTSGSCSSGENTAVFGEQTYDYSGQEFRGVELNGIFGSVTLDLRDAIILEDCTIEANSVFGSVEILTGSNANYEVGGTGVFGTVNDTIRRERNSELPTVTIQGSAVFGSVEVR